MLCGALRLLGRYLGVRLLGLPCLLSRRLPLSTITLSDSLRRLRRVGRSKREGVAGKVAIFPCAHWPTFSPADVHRPRLHSMGISRCAPPSLCRCPCLSKRLWSRCSSSVLLASHVQWLKGEHDA